MKRLFNSLLAALLVFALVLPLAVYSDYPEIKVYIHEDYLIEYRVMNSWDNAQNVNVTISNTGDDSIIGWAVKYNAGGEITGLWNGVIYKSENENYIIKNSVYNSEIKPNESISFGYTLSGEDLIAPENIEICSHRSVKSSGFKVEMIETGNWGTGFQAEINISNLTEKSIEAWELSFDGNFAVEEIWNAKIISEEENTYKTSGLEGNTVIQPDSSVKFGMRAEKEEAIQPVIENIVLSEMLIDDNFTLDSEEERDEFDDEIYCKELSEETLITQDGDGLPYVANQLLVMADDSVSFEDMEAYAADMNAKIVGYIETINKYQIEFTDVNKEHLQKKIDEFKLNTLIENVSHNYVFELGEDSVPNDPQYALYNSENNINNSDWNLHAINVFRAWDYYDKMIPIKIGVVDSTFDENHDDLSFKKVWGKFRNMGFDFLGINGHGTHVAGIMAADFNDGVGISGICPKNELYGYTMGVKSDLATFETGLSKLIENDIKVINVSRNNLPQVDSTFLTNLKNNQLDNEFYLSWAESAEDLSLTIKVHLDEGYDFVILSAAGNKDINTVYNGWLNYIKDQRVKNHIITVSSTKNNNSNYDASENLCYGSRIDVSAPGENILSSIPGNSYDIKSGTSMAAPHVSGIAGMMYSVNPDISGTEIKEIIKGTSKLRTVKDSHGYEYGIADARLAVSTAYYHQADNPDKIVFGKLEDKNDPSNKFANVKIAVSYDGQERSIYSDDNGEFEIVIPKETETGSLKYQIDGYAASAKVEAEYLRSTAVVNVDLAPSDAPAYLSDPDYALYSALPEPEANEIYALVRVAVSGEKLWIYNCYSLYDNAEDFEKVSLGTVDYGDGTSSEIVLHDYDNPIDYEHHTYDEAGDYIVKITYTPVEGIKNSFNFYRQEGKLYPIGVKIGSDVIYDDVANYISPDTFVGAIENVKYVKFYSDYWCSDKFSFTSASFLQRIEYTASKKFTSLNGYGSYGKFSFCYALDFSNLMDLFSEITEVPRWGFKDCRALTEMSLPKCTKIEDEAFSGCYSLKSINIPNCTEISVNKSPYYTSGAFDQCRSLVMINLPVCENIGEDAFYCCNSLQKVYAPQCREVGSYAFGYCSALTDVKLSDSCIYGDNAFIGCTRLVPSPALT